MNTEKLTGVQIVSSEVLCMYPDALHRAIEEISRNVIDSVICKLEDGEVICRLNDAEQIQTRYNSVEIRRSISFTPLVRCVACKHFAYCVIANSLGKEGYCSMGER